MSAGANAGRGRQLGAAAILGWLVLLAFLATPDQLLPEPVVPLKQQGRSLFVDLRLDCGQPVFNDVFPDEKRRHTCVAIIGESADGSLRDLYRSFGDCHPPPVRFRIRALDLVYYRLLRRTASASIRRPDEERLPVRQSIAEGLARYHCVTADPPVRRVHLTILQESISYVTGRIGGRADIAFDYDCELQRRVSDEGLVLSFGPDGPRLDRAVAAAP